MELPFIIALTLAILTGSILLVFWSKRKKSNFPAVEGLPIVGSIYFPWYKLPEMSISLSQQLGHIFQINILWMRLILVTDSSTVKSIMKNDKDFVQTPEVQMFRLAVPGPPSLEGEVWKRQHNAIIAVIQRRNLMKMVPAMTSSMESMLERWKKHSPKELSCFEVFHELKASVIRALIEGVFEVKLSHDEAYDFAMANFNRLSHAYIWLQIHRVLSFLPKDLLFLYPPTRQSMQITDKYLDLIMNRHYDNPIPNIEKIEEIVPPDEVREVVETLCYTGHDSTSITLSSILHLLGRNQEIQQKVRESLTDLTPEGVMKNKYLEAVIKEGLRLMPIGAIVARSPKEPLVLEGVTIEPKETIMLSTYAIHRNPDYWKDPERFDPERFFNQTNFDEMNEAENIAYPTNFAYIPFSGGKRTCTGQQLAMFQLMQMTAILLTKIQINIPTQEPELKSIFSWSRRPEEGVYLDISFL